MPNTTSPKTTGHRYTKTELGQLRRRIENVLRHNPKTVLVIAKALNIKGVKS